jgi:beta-glucosidase-like glycosyl hydrolase
MDINTKDNTQSQMFILNKKLKNINQSEKNINQSEKNIIRLKEQNNKNESINKNEIDEKNIQKSHVKKPIFKKDINILKSNIDIAKEFFKEIENDKTEELKKELSDKKQIINKKQNIYKKQIIDKKNIELNEKDILAIKMLIKYLNKY